MAMKKIHRSKENKVWKGVIGGFGEYFNVDPVLLRVIFIFFVLATGIFPGVIGYIIAIFIIPKAKEGPMTSTVEKEEEKSSVKDDVKIVNN